MVCTRKNPIYKNVSKVIFKRRGIVIYFFTIYGKKKSKVFHLYEHIHKITMTDAQKDKSVSEGQSSVTCENCSCSDGCKIADKYFNEGLDLTEVCCALYSPTAGLVTLKGED